MWLPLVAPAITVLASTVLAQPAPQKFKTAPGFTVERIYSVPRESQGSWVALAPDVTGGLFASDQYGPLYRLTLPARKGAAVRQGQASAWCNWSGGVFWLDCPEIESRKSVYSPLKVSRWQLPHHALAPSARRRLLANFAEL